MKPSIAQSPEFLNWLKTQKEKPEYNYKATRYYQEKAAGKNKDKFLKATAWLLVLIYFLLLIIVFI